MDNQFKNSQGQWRTKSLFVEYNKEGLFSIADLKAKYLEANDLTEYRFALDSLGGWQHWKALQESPFLRMHIAQWREELELSIRAEALARIINVSKSNSKDGFIATRYLADRQWVTPAEKGRPTKAQVAAKAKDLAVEHDRIANDAERLGLAN